MDDSLSVAVKTTILKQIIAVNGPIVITNEQYCCEQIVESDGTFRLDCFSPRENAQISDDPISVDKAWEHVMTLCPALVAKYVAADASDQNRK